MKYKLAKTSKPGYIVTDDREFDPERCTDGGAYRYTITFVPQIHDWKVVFGTSSDFPYCRTGGEFRDCDRCQFACNFFRADDPAQFTADWLGYDVDEVVPFGISVEAKDVIEWEK